MSTAADRRSNDFLTRLAGRALGVEPFIRPRLPSVFETSAAAGALDRPVIDLSDEGAPAGSAMPLSAILPPVRAPAPPIAEKITPQRIVRSPPLENSGAHDDHGPLPSPVGAHRRFEKPDPISHTAAAVRPASLNVPPTTNRTSFPSHDRLLQARRHRGVWAADDRADDPAGASTIVSPANLHAPVVPLAPAPATILPVIVTPGVHRPSERHLALRGKAPIEHVVNVTIGRIDVRATQPAPVAQRRAVARPNPPQSLADYLKQRAAKR